MQAVHFKWYLTLHYITCWTIIILFIEMFSSLKDSEKLRTSGMSKSPVAISSGLRLSQNLLSDINSLILVSLWILAFSFASLFSVPKLSCSHWHWQSSCTIPFSLCQQGKVYVKRLKERFLLCMPVGYFVHWFRSSIDVYFFFSNLRHTLHTCSKIFEVLCFVNILFSENLKLSCVDVMWNEYTIFFLIRWSRSRLSL